MAQTCPLPPCTQLCGQLFRIGITSNPTELPPPPPPASKPDLSKQKKFKFSWRTNMLAAPKHVENKYIAPPCEPLPPRVFEELEPETEFRADHLARPNIRILVVNKKQVEAAHLSRKIALNLKKRMKISWKSIYNYYKNKLRMRKMKALRRQEKSKGKDKEKGKNVGKGKEKDKRAGKVKGKGKEMSEEKKAEELENARNVYFANLAAPRKSFKPEPLPVRRKNLEELKASIARLALPREYDIDEPRDVTKVPSAALTYEITESVRKLAEIPARMKMKPPEPRSYFVPPKDYKVSPRIEELSKPAPRAAKKEDDLKEDPWTISKNALKYKATPRILELSKPIDRD